MSTSSNPRYIAYLYDKNLNLTTTHLDTRIVLNKDENGELGNEV